LSRAVENRSLRAVRASRFHNPYHACAQPPPSSRESQTGDDPDQGSPRGAVVLRHGARPVRYLDLARAVRERSEESEIRGVQFQPKGGPGIAPSTCEGLNSLISFLSQLEARCPELVDPGSWQQAIEDGRRFLARWGEQAEGLGWSSRDLFGLAPVPDKPAANYRRLSRYDETGLIW